MKYLKYFIILLSLSGCGKATAKLMGDDQLTKFQIEEIKDLALAKIEELQFEFKAKMEGLINTKINSDTETNTSGRDMIIAPVNETALIKDYNKYFYGMFLLLLSVMKWQSMKQAGQYKRTIKMLEIEKKDYKNRFLAVGIRNDEELSKFRKEHEALKK